MPPVKVKGQQVRFQAHIEKIFQEAGLLIFEKQKQLNLHPDYYQVVMWALY